MAENPVFVQIVVNFRNRKGVDDGRVMKHQNRYWTYPSMCVIVPSLQHPLRDISYRLRKKNSKMVIPRTCSDISLLPNMHRSLNCFLFPFDDKTITAVLSLSERCIHSFVEVEEDGGFGRVSVH